MRTSKNIHDPKRYLTEYMEPDEASGFRSTASNATGTLNVPPPPASLSLISSTLQSLIPLNITNLFAGVLFISTNIEYNSVALPSTRREWIHDVMYYVYVLRSKHSGNLYIGKSKDLKSRL